MLRDIIEELRRHFDAVSRAFDHLRTRALALLVGEVTIVAFIFAQDGQPLNLGQIYGAIFLGIGALLLAIAFIALLWILSPAQLMHPPDTKRARKTKLHYNDRPIRFLKELRDDYCDAIHYCIGIISRRSKIFVWALYMLAIGVSILITLKYGGGAIIKL